MTTLTEYDKQSVTQQEFDEFMKTWSSDKPIPERIRAFYLNQIADQVDRAFAEYERKGLRTMNK